MDSKSQNRPGKIEAVYRGFRNLSTAVVIACLLFIAANLGLGLIHTIRAWRQPDFGNPIANAYGMSLAPVYPGWTKDQVDVLLNTTWRRTKPLAYEPFTAFKERPFSSQDVNISDAGFRRSKGQGPWPPRRGEGFTVFVFGGSTTFGYGVRDEETLVSYLHDFISIEHPDCRVYNFGRGFYFSAQERILFEQLLLAGAVPDLAIFIDGLNDFYYVSGLPEFSDYLTKVFDEGGPFETSNYTCLGSAAKSLPLVRSLLNVWQKRILSRGKEHKLQPELDKDNEATMKVIERYAANKRMIEAVAALNDVNVFFCIHPVPFYKYNPTTDLFRDVGFEEYRWSRLGYPEMVARAQSGYFGAHFCSCVDIHEGKNEPLYVDRIHYSPAMNKYIAEEIYKQLRLQKVM